MGLSLSLDIDSPSLYGDYGMSNIDLYIGGILESNNGPGPLFR